MKGRRPKPTHLRLVTGNPGKRPVNKREPKPARGRPRAPPHLSDRARAAWRKVAPLLEQMGVLTVADGIALEALCEAYADLTAARAALAAAGSPYIRIELPGGVIWKAHPAVAQRNDADRRFRAWLSEFGLTPSARARVQAGGAPEPDPAERFFS